MELVKVEFDKVNKKSFYIIAALSGVPAVIIAIKIINNLGLGKGEDTALEILAFFLSSYLRNDSACVNDLYSCNSDKSRK